MREDGPEEAWHEAMRRIREAPEESLLSILEQASRPAEIYCFTHRCQVRRCPVTCPISYREIWRIADA